MTKIYLLSKPKIIDQRKFLNSLESLLKTGLVSMFQLRLKGYTEKEITKIAKEIRKVCTDYGCLFLLNDSYKIAFDVGADGVHLGAEDGSIFFAKEEAKVFDKNFLIGASCYDSKELAMKAAKDGADYISFGTFFLSKTKNSVGKPMPEIIKWCKNSINLPIVGIGGITSENCQSLVRLKIDFLAVISCIWDDLDGEVSALKKLNLAIRAATIL